MNRTLDRPSLGRWLAALVCAAALAPLGALAGPGSALQFDGLHGYVQVAHNTNLNAFPLTVTAWFRTTNAAAAVSGIVSKYVDGLGNGWFLIVQNGHLVGYYSALLGNQAVYATSAAAVADGFWHHAALAVDASGGKLYLGRAGRCGNLDGAAGAAHRNAAAADRPVLHQHDAFSRDD